MANKISEGALAYIISPAFGPAVGRLVEVVRRATGDCDVDGAVYDDDGSNAATWVVLGNHVPWGDGFANVFAIEEVCLRLFISPVKIKITEGANSVPMTR